MKKKQVVLVVMDGVGITEKDNGNAVMHAYKPHLDKLLKEAPNILLKAHGTAVGLPSNDDMGNSEVGHNALGCGQIYSQGAKLVNESIASGAIYQTETWKELISYSKDHTLHFLGLLSDGNVHSHINHLISMIKEAKKDGIKKVRIHALLDGRDVPETSALIYVDMLEKVLAELNDEHFDARIASGGGRMYITMDRYEANWKMVEKGWHTHVLGEGRNFSSTTEAIETYRKELDVSDQDLPEFVIVKDGKPIGTINDGDSVILFNFRGDRAIEISKAFDHADFNQFDRVRFPKVKYAGMLQYDGDLKIPSMYLVQPPKIKNTLSEYLVKNGLKQYAISETQKYGHVTYFWNGNRTEKFNDELETFVEIKSDVIPFEQRPWMKAAEITDELIKAIESKEFDFLRCNYPNGDMVGHTGNYQATLIGVETVDLCLARIISACAKTDSILLVTADHGNADEMYEKRKNDSDPIKPKTSHTLNKVPFIVYNADVKMKDGSFGLANVASTVVDLLGLPAVSIWQESVLQK
ncbi:MAG: 2,3-bisphosphoglycerate-independent phosphoglycerate mutase [Erysipelotrichaceae bacterium]|nr:2,3-bisphosphoglycerate-independent phosphoglycerate mutase [Erysipelotrichaceae bacterium]